MKLKRKYSIKKDKKKPKPTQLPHKARHSGHETLITPYKEEKI
jgi:hypothetical protein